MHQLGAVIAMIVLGIGGLVLAALAIMMMIGAIMPKRSEITSWPAAQEASFTPFNQRSLSSHGQAWMFSIIGAVTVFFLIVGIYFGVTPEIRDYGKTMNMSNLTKKARTSAPAPAPKQEAAPAPAEEPKADTPKAEDPPKTEEAPK